MAIFQTFFLGSFGQENVFYDILEPRNTFLVYKREKFKTLKNCHFSKGVKPWFRSGAHDGLLFRSKNGHFFYFLSLGHICQENVFYDILEPKNAFLGYKKEKFKKSKN